MKKTQNSFGPIGFFLLVVLCVLFYERPAQASESLVVYYGSDNDSRLQDFDVLVFDSDHHPNLEPFVKAHKTTLCYLSLGEVDKNRSYFKDLKKQNLFLGHNPTWKSAYIDIRNKKWSEFVLTKLAPDCFAQGFTGLFLDTLDDPPYLEGKHKKWQGLTEAAIALVKSLHETFPDRPLMINRGFEILPKIINDVNMVLAECLVATYNFSKKKYEMVKPETVAAQRKELQSLKTGKPALKLFSLDYWNDKDSDGVKHIYQIERDQGFSPYVATIDLMRIVTPP